jgi:CRP-like cAMP-binding protein
MNKGKRQLLDRLVRSRFKSNDDLGRIYDEHRDAALAAQRLGTRTRPKVLRGVHNGNYYRVTVRAPQQPPPVLPNIPKLPPPMSAQPPVAFKKVPPPAASVETSTPSSSSAASSTASAASPAGGGGGEESSSPSTSTSTSANATGGFASAANLEAFRYYRRRLHDWWKENWSVIVLNVGSICTLMAFTRSDVLELRSLSVVGSTCSVVYQLTQVPIRWPPVLWSMLFAGVNSFKIYNILQERNSHVRLTEDQERMYVQHFLPHGVTPKQFEIVLHRAKIRSYPKGSVILKQGDKLEKVQLVVRGATRANILGRRVSAASMPSSSSSAVSGDDDDSESMPVDTNPSPAARASAWIGEMTFLEKYWMQEQRHLQLAKARDKTAKPPSAVRTESSPASSSQSDTPRTEDDPARPDLASELLVPSVEGVSTARRSSGSQTKSDNGKAGEVVLASKRTVRPIDASDIAAPEAKTDYSMYTIVAVEDCTVLEWSHQDMQALMERSTDLRAALTRALSSAVVGKVINFTISKSQAHRSWSQWLDDWKNSDGATIQVRDGDDAAAAAAAAAAESAKQPTKIGDPLVAEALPTHPIKKFS